MSQPKRIFDRRIVESQADSKERFVRVLRGDVAWWRENASVIPDKEPRDVALEVAAGLERLLDSVCARWGVSR